MVALIREVVEAVGFAHQHDLVHRDLKPANLLVDRHGHPHVADFGLAVDENSQGLRTGEVSGTPAYMSPEQVRGLTHVLDGRSDLWSIGVILYELLTERRPFRGAEPGRDLRECEAARSEAATANQARHSQRVGTDLFEMSAEATDRSLRVGSRTVGRPGGLVGQTVRRVIHFQSSRYAIQRDSRHNATRFVGCRFHRSRK